VNAVKNRNWVFFWVFPSIGDEIQFSLAEDTQCNVYLAYSVQDMQAVMEHIMTSETIVLPHRTGPAMHEQHRM